MDSLKKGEELAEIVVDNAKGTLLPGMTANTSLIVFQAKSQILIPSHAGINRTRRLARIGSFAPRVLPRCQNESSPISYPLTDRS